MAAVNFPNNPSVNDTHTSSGSTWKWDGTVWQRLGVAGPQGAQGAQGRQGAAGAAGAQGAQGVQGANGAAGAQGAQGHQGVQGAAGAQGAQGVVSDAIQNTKAGTNAGGNFSGSNAVGNTLYGWGAGQSLTTGDENVYIGHLAGKASDGQSRNIGIGYSVLQANNGGENNVMIGQEVAVNATDVQNSICIGDRAGYWGISDYAVVIGKSVGYSNPNDHTIAIGEQAGYSNAGEHCISLGYQAGYNSGGKYGVNIGYNAGYSQSSNNKGNVAIGYHALKHENGNEYCVGIGNSCYLPIKGENTGASDNQLVIGVGHTAWIVGNKSYNIGLGVTNPSERLHLPDDKKIVLGNSSDLQFWHTSGGNSYIKETGGGSLVINADDFYLQNNATTTFLRTHSAGAIDLNYNGNKKLETTSSGVLFTGTDFGFNTTPGGTPAGKAVFIAIGDSDTGIVQDGDGQLELWANDNEVANISAIDGYLSTKPITTSNNITMGYRLIHDGDTDTYMQYDTDAIALVTGGTGRINIDANGVVNITRRLELTNSGDNHSVYQGRAWTWTSNGQSSGSVRAYMYGDSSSNLLIGTNGWNERLRIDSAGRVQIGHTGSLVGGRIELHRASAETWMTINESSDSGSGPALYINRTRGSNLTSPSPIANGNWLGNVYFGSYDTNSYEIGARIAAAADGQTWANGDCPARLMFFTTPDGSTTPTERLRIDSNGDVGINVTDPLHKLHVKDTSSTNSVALFDSAIASSSLSGNTAHNGYGHAVCLENSNTTASNIVSLGFQVRTSSAYANAAITTKAVDTSGNSMMAFWNEENNTIKERMKIYADGHITVQGSGPWSDPGVTDFRMFNGNFDLADDSSVSLSSAANTGALVCVGSFKRSGGSITYASALFFITYGSTTITEISDPRNIFSTSDTDGQVCVLKTTSTGGTFSVKNRIGVTNKICVNIIGLQGL